MKKVNVEDAIGMTLCHDVTAMRDGFKGAQFVRGHVIREEDIPVLLDIGKKTIFVWEEHTGDIHEDDAAIRMSRAMGPIEGTCYTKPSEGKILLKATSRGMFRVDVDLLRDINAIGDITICTLPDHYPVEPGARMASMRIVPLVTDIAQIEAMEQMCEGRTLVDLRPYRPRTIGVVITGSEIFSGRIQDKFEPVVRAKMATYPATILGVTICDDDLNMITDAARAYMDQGADFLIFTGGMSVDPDDLTPTAIRRLGAEIITHGVPSQPGNMTLVAYLDDIAMIGVPGAAISLPTTMFDVVLPQIFAGDRFTKEQLTRLGDGGLCQMCEVCHFPNCTFGRY
ncbi:MAG: molybdopterin-binding protein [Saccharofermentanales bacterium]|jgi:molybdenum cofactor synthesis domain-containing protein